MNITTYARLTKEWCRSADHSLPPHQKVRRSLRYYPRWLRYRRRKQRSPELTTLDLSVPWITFEAVEHLLKILRPSSRVFEYGCGGSTMFLARHVGSVVSVEHDARWYESVAAMLAARGLTNVSLTLAPPQHDRRPQGLPEHPGSFASSAIPNASFEQYVTTIDRYPDASFDLVSVDGRARPSCMLRAMSKVKPGGYLMLDNSERLDRYSQGIALLRSWDRRVFFGPGPINDYFWETTFWTKPSSR